MVLAIEWCCSNADIERKREYESREGIKSLSLIFVSLSGAILLTSEKARWKEYTRVLRFEKAGECWAHWVPFPFQFGTEVVVRIDEGKAGDDAGFGKKRGDRENRGRARIRLVMLEAGK